MSPVSLTFAGFVLGALVVYYAAPARLQTVVLLLASLLFCASWGWSFPLVLLALAGFNFVIARHLPPDRRPSPWLLPGALGVNVVALVAFKYGGLLGSTGAEVLVPVGISFYTLSALAYLIDVARGQGAPSRHFADFALFLAYFPKLLAGPIERAQAFLPQLVRSRIVDNDAVARALALILLGCVRKVVIADSIRARVGEYVFQQPGGFSAIELAIALVGYLFMLYNDFAGYTDIARGVSRLFGIELAVNFRTPFFARSFAEFWTRWHVSLSQWLRDYVFFPVSRTLLRRDPDPSTLLNLFAAPLVTLVVSSLWHSVSLNVLLWGGLMGLWLGLERWVADRRNGRPPRFWRLVMLVALGLTAVPFRLELPVAAVFWWGLFRIGDWHLTEPAAAAGVTALAALSLAIDAAQWRAADELVFLRWPRPVRSLLVAGALLAVFLATRAELARDFVYQGF